MANKNFLHHLAQQEPRLTLNEIAVALLWLNGNEDYNVALSAGQLADEMVAAGFAGINKTRLEQGLIKDKRTAHAGSRTFRIKINARLDLETKYSGFLDTRPVKPSNSVLPLELLKDTRGYIEKVGLQINGSYDAGMYDCCAVMCRRLLETLIIEIYENLGRASNIRGLDNNFFMFSGLLGVLEKDSKISLGRNAIRGLKDFKSLGDSSAHNRRFNARKPDIDAVKSDMRIAVEELVHLANFS